MELKKELSKNQSPDRCKSYRKMIKLLWLNHQKISNCDDKNSCVFVNPNNISDITKGLKSVLKSHKKQRKLLTNSKKIIEKLNETS